jgi:predicted adenylyl cyclase CyaB
MVQEKEIKIKFSQGTSRELIEKKLEQFGAKKVKSTKQTDTYFDNNQAFLLLNDHVIRIREETEKQPSFCFKTIFYFPEPNKWYVDEIEHHISELNSEKINPVLERLSLNLFNHDENVNPDTIKQKLASSEIKEYLKIIKDRSIYQKENTFFMLDEVENLGLYLEIECLDENDPDTILNSLNLNCIFDEIRLGYTNEYLSKVKNQQVHGKEKYINSPRWNVLNGEESIYDSLKKNG